MKNRSWLTKQLQQASNSPHHFNQIMFLSTSTGSNAISSSPTRTESPVGSPKDSPTYSPTLSFLGVDRSNPIPVPRKDVTTHQHFSGSSVGSPYSKEEVRHSMKWRLRREQRRDELFEKEEQQNTPCSQHNGR